MISESTIDPATDIIDLHSNIHGELGAGMAGNGELKSKLAND